MAKKKNKKKRFDVTASSLQELLSNGERFIQQNNFRGAIEILKTARKKFPEDKTIVPLFFKSYMGREIQLREKGMLKEADAIHKIAAAYQPDFSKVSSKDLLFYMKASSMGEMATFYHQYLKENPSLIEAEYLILSSALSTPGVLSKNGFLNIGKLKMDAPILKKAMAYMNEGAWEKALSQLKPISRNSPVAPIKLICRAMVSFYADDQKGMERAISLIPDTFPLKSAFSKLCVPTHQYPFLYEDTLITQKHIAQLKKAIYSRDPSSVKKIMELIGEIIWPLDPQYAIEEIANDAISLCGMGNLDINEFRLLIYSSLDDDKAHLMHSKLNFRLSINGISDLSDYLSILNEEFPKRQDHHIAAAMVLTYFVSNRNSSGITHEEWYSLDNRVRKKLGATSKELETGLIEILLNAMKHDPDNRTVYETLCNMPRSIRKSKALVEKGLLQMIKRYPEDPEPCIILSSIYDEKNAFRKSIAILQEAKKRAHFDDRINNAFVYSLILSSDINVKREKYHLVKKDLDQAMKVSNQHTLPLVTAKKIRFHFENEYTADELVMKYIPKDFILKKIKGFDEFSKIMMFSILLNDVEERKTFISKQSLKAIQSLSKAQFKQIDQVSSKQILELLTLNKSQMKGVINDDRWLGSILEKQKTILKYLSDKDFIKALDVLIAQSLFAPCIKEINRRKKILPSPEKEILEFYKVTILHFNGTKKNDRRAFETIIDKFTDAKYHEMLKETSQRLAPHASGPLKPALQEFNFIMLDMDCDCPECRSKRGETFFDEPFDLDPSDLNPLINIFGNSEEDGPTDNDFKNFLKSVGKVPNFISQIEDFIDDNHLRGKSRRAIQKARKKFFRQMDAGDMESILLATLFEDDLKSGLSKEGYTLLFE